MKSIRTVRTLLVFLGVSIAALSSVTTAEAQTQRTYDNMSDQDRKLLRSTMAENGLTQIRLCLFDQLCEGRRCTKTNKAGELATMPISTSRGTADIVPFNGAWFGPEGRTDARGVAIGSVLGAIGSGYGDRVSLLSIDDTTGLSRLTLHGTMELWARTYSGTCKVIR